MSDLTGEELAGGWRKLCGALIGYAADALREKDLGTVLSSSGLLYRAEAGIRRRVAAAWVNGAEAMVPFAEACEVLDMHEDYARRAFDKYLESRSRPPAA